MWLLRLLAVLTVITVAGGVVVFLFTRDQRYLFFAWRVFRYALIVALLVHWTGLIMLLAVGFMTIAMVLVMKPGTPYWQFVTFLTPAIVLLEGAGSSIVQTDVTRLGFTLLGVAVGMVVLGIAYLIRQRAGDGSNRPSDNAAAGTLPPLGPSEPAP